MPEGYPPLMTPQCSRNPRRTPSCVVLPRPGQPPFTVDSRGAAYLLFFFLAAFFLAFFAGFFAAFFFFAMSSPPFRVPGSPRDGHAGDGASHG